MPLQTTAPAKTATNTEPIKKIQSNTCTRRSESTLRDGRRKCNDPQSLGIFPTKDACAIGRFTHDR